MGLQNVMARRLAVPDLTTTVLTMTLTGIAADIRSGNSATAVRRLLAVGAMALGAVVGLSCWCTRRSVGAWHRRPASWWLSL